VNDDLEPVIGLLDAQIRGGRSLDQARSELSRFVSEELIGRAVEEFARRTGRIIRLREPATLRGEGLR